MKKPFELPEIATYERDELVIDTAFTGFGSIAPSDRNLKENFGSVNPMVILRRLTRIC
jgi:hypothetical protein